MCFSWFTNVSTVSASRTALGADKPLRLLAPRIAGGGGDVDADRVALPSMPS
jgi:hypothetical protein